MKKDNINFWSYLWVLFPFILGIAVSFFVAGWSPQTPDEKVLRLVSFLVGWSIGFSIQVAELGRRFGGVLKVVGKSLNVFHFLFGKGETYVLLRKIVRLSERFEKDTDHLPPELKNKVLGWIANFLQDTHTESLRFAENKAIFNPGEGMKVDHDLVKLASSSIRASAHITNDSVEFWRTQPEGQRYRESCIEKSKELGKAKFDANGSLVSGVARLFIIDSSTLRSVKSEDPKSKELISNVLKEATQQQSSGIKVRILVEDDVQGKKTTILDILLIDNILSSSTLSKETGGVGRRISVLWRQSKVNILAREWDRMWGVFSYSINEFRTAYNFPNSKPDPD